MHLVLRAGHTLNGRVKNILTINIIIKSNNGSMKQIALRIM